MTLGSEFQYKAYNLKKKLSLKKKCVYKEYKGYGQFGAYKTGQMAAYKASHPLITVSYTHLTLPTKA